MRSSRSRPPVPWRPATELVAYCIHHPYPLRPSLAMLFCWYGIAALVSLGLLKPISAGDGVLGCHSFQHNFTNIFREYVSVPEPHYRSLYREWNSFCVGLNKSQSHSAEDIRVAWARYTTYRPLSSCRLRVGEAQRTSTAAPTPSPTPAEISLAPVGVDGAKAISICPCLAAAAPNLTALGDEENDNNSLWRLCFDVAEVTGVLVLALYAISRKILRHYAVRRAEDHGDAVPESLFHNRDGPKFWRSVNPWR